MPKHWTESDIAEHQNEATTPEDIAQRYSANTITGWAKPTEDEITAHGTLGTALESFDEPPRDTFLWRPLDILRADLQLSKWEPQYQRRGTCVGQGHKLALDDLMAYDHLCGVATFPGRAAVAAIYAGSRVEVAKSPGRWDGSNGSWACDWLLKWGLVTMKELELHEDDQVNDERLAVTWAGGRDGVPPNFEEMAKTKPLTSTPLLRTELEAARMIQLGYPVVQCSSFIPSSRRDTRGVAQVSRGGGHCTEIRGVRHLENGRRLFLYQNSWNGWGTGPIVPDDQPPGSVWIDQQDLQRMIDQQDTHALIGIRGLTPHTGPQL